MRRLAWHNSFKRAFRKHTRYDTRLKESILSALDALSENPFHPRLRTHKLSGKLQELWACWVEYDCRIIFAFEPDPSRGEDLIVVVDIGSHDEVY